MTTKLIHFDHEKLSVYQRSLKFITWLTEVLELIMSKIRTCSVVLGMFLTLPLGAADWPGWGGTDPGRNMYSPMKGLPDRFEPGKAKPGTEDIDLKTT